MDDKDRRKARLQGIQSALDKLEAEYATGEIDVGRYLRLKTKYETLKAALEQGLDVPDDVSPIETENLREKELAYLDNLLARYEYWLDHYTPLAGIAEVRAAVKDGPRLDLPMPFIPPGFEKLVEHGYGERAEVRREPVDDLRAAVAEHQRIVLLGAPGSGKTTTLWRMAYDYAQVARDDDQAPLPVLVPLGGYSGPEPLDAYLARHLGPLAPYLETCRASNRLILLLDGLNEMPRAGYTERLRRIQDALDQYPDGIAVITCRALDYAVKLERLQEVEVLPLDDERISTFLHNYLGEMAGRRLFQAMTKEQPPLLVMGRNPYMLLMTAQVYASAGGELPTNRASLLAAFSDTLLEREKKRHREGWIEAERQKSGLAALAYAMQVEQEAGTTVECSWAADQLNQAVPDCDVERLLYLAASAMLLDLDGEQVRFHHQLFQEFFTARHIVDNTVKGTLPRLLAHAADDHWREVIILTAAMLDDADLFFECFLRGLDDLVHGDEGLIAFLEWAARRAATVQAGSHPAALRSYYCYHDIERARARVRARAHARVLDLVFFPVHDPIRVFEHDLDQDLDRALDIALARAFSRALDLARALDLDRARALARARALDLDRALDLALNLALDRALGLDLDRALNLNLALALNRAQELGFDALHQALSALAPPPEHVITPKDWYAFADCLQEIMIEHRDIGHDRRFTREQAKRLERYFYTAELLVQCLNLAVVTDRAAIEDRLLLPPGWDEDSAAREQE